MKKIFLVFFLVAGVITGSLAQPVIQGWADFSAIDFKNTRQLALSGAWEFYWNQLLFPGDFTADHIPTWVEVPGSWHRSGQHPQLGFGTYRVRIRFSGEQGGLSLYFPIINSASRIWLNGELVRETGVVGKDRNSYKAELTASMVSVPEKVKEIEIVVQASNFVYYNSGVGNSPRLGQGSAILGNINTANGIENFFAGSLIAMCVYQLILYFLYHRGKPHLWLALICLGVALRSMIVHGGSFLLPNLFPDVSFETWKKIEFGSVYAVAALFPLYIFHLFIESAPKWPIFIFVGLSSALVATVLVTPQYIYGDLLDVGHIALLLAFIYAFYSIIRSWISGNRDAKIILFGVLASFPFILMEILKNSVLFAVNIELFYLVEIGVLVFLLFQVYLLANNQAQSYKTLEVLNQSLEKKVEERTTEWVTANTVKDRLLSVMSHDLKSPLNSLHGILHMYNSGAIGKEEFNQFAQQIEGDLNKTKMLVENVLYWTASQLKGVEMKMEKMDLTALIHENIQLFITVAARKKITLSQNLSGPMHILWDKNILNLVLRNLLANAIKFSYEGGEVKILVDKEIHVLSIRVKDNGIGMNRDVMTSILSPGRASSNSGTGNEKGTGLGLSLCRDYLLKAGATLTVESVEGAGSSFIINIPL